MSEFNLIRRLQDIIGADSATGRLAPLVGIGDDGAVLEVPPGQQIVVTTDTLIEGVHFLPGTEPGDIGYKALAVNLSDIAAMGAHPAWFFIALSMPRFESAWLDNFALGIANLAAEAGIVLAGGDTTSGSLSITITAIGLVENGRALTRSGAREGNLVAVSGNLGDAAHALKVLTAGSKPEVSGRAALDRPQPRLELGRRLQGLATACIDISDGLLADLGHILEASNMGAEIELELLPTSPMLTLIGATERQELQTAGGDDYELCFTFPAERLSELARITQESGLRLTVIGKITASGRLVCKDGDGVEYEPVQKGYEHFSLRPGADP